MSYNKSTTTTIAALLVVVMMMIMATLAVAQKETHCIDKDFTTHSILLDPSQKYDDEHVVYFSSTTQKQRIDINEMEPEIKTFSVYQRYDQGKMYIYDKQTKDCQVHALHGQLKQFCLAANATHETQVSIGGSLKADIWKEEVYGFEIRLILSSFQNIPINIFTRGSTHRGVVMQEWFNYKHGVESDRIFDIPSACNQQMPARSLQTHLAESSSIPTKRILEKVSKLTMGYTKQ